MSRFKIIFLGNQSVGKTSVISRFMDEQFEDNGVYFQYNFLPFQPTIGVDWYKKVYHIDGRTIKL